MCGFLFYFFSLSSSRFLFRNFSILVYLGCESYVGVLYINVKYLLVYFLSVDVHDLHSSLPYSDARARRVTIFPLFAFTFCSIFF